MTSKKKKNQLTILNTTCEEFGFLDVWRHFHPLERDYTHYSISHSDYSRIDYFLMQKEDCYGVTDCRIGVADVSDHNAIYITIQMDSGRKNTVWHLNVGILNDKTTVNDFKLEIKP